MNAYHELSDGTYTAFTYNRKRYLVLTSERIGTTFYTVHDGVIERVDATMDRDALDAMNAYFGRNDD